VLRSGLPGPSSPVGAAGDTGLGVGRVRRPWANPLPIRAAGTSLRRPKNALRTPAETTLIARVHGIQFTEFRDRLFKPLELVVTARPSDRIRDYVYRSRHPHIAELLFERIMSDPQQRFDEYLRVISALDVSYDADRDALRGMTNAKHLGDLFSDPKMVRQLFSRAYERSPDSASLYQQEAIFEMSHGMLTRAGELLAKAKRLNPKTPAIDHSLSELALKNAQQARTTTERQKYRADARQIASRLIAGRAATSHPWHTLLKLTLEELKEALEQQNDTVVTEKIKESEKLLSQALQAFPNDSFLLNSEAEFCDVIQQDERGLSALRRAFASNKRSPYVALRLARLNERRGDMEGSLGVLRECADANPEDKDVQFRLGMLLVQTSGAPADIIHHLRRAFTKGDARYEAQFWHARALFLDSQRIEAGDWFRDLSDAQVASTAKHQARGLVEQDGRAVRFAGRIDRPERFNVIIVRDGDQLRLSGRRDSFLGDSALLASGRRVTFELAFNYRGPIAVNIALEEHER
jgi:tetratricopeptide (TPR) repeat protein